MGPYQLYMGCNIPVSKICFTEWNPCIGPFIGVITPLIAGGHQLCGGFRACFLGRRFHGVWWRTPWLKTLPWRVDYWDMLAMKKGPSCLGYTGDVTTQLYGNYCNKPLYWTTSILENKRFFSWLMLPMIRPSTHGCLESILQVKKNDQMTSSIDGASLLLRGELIRCFEEKKTP